MNKKEIKVDDSTAKNVSDIFDECTAYRLAMDHYAKRLLLAETEAWRVLKEAANLSDEYNYAYDNKTGIITRAGKKSQEY